jgi:hypothetical protein
MKPNFQIQLCTFCVLIFNKKREAYISQYFPILAEKEGFPMILKINCKVFVFSNMQIF